MGTRLLDTIKDRLYLVSAYTRRLYDAGTPFTITTDNIEIIFDSIPKLSSPLENLNLTLLLIMTRQKRADEYIDLKLGTDFPLVYAHDTGEYSFLYHILKDQELIETPGSFDTVGLARLTPQGWQRAIELQKTQRNSDQAFVAMSFTKELFEIWDKGIKPALESTGFKPYRVDQKEHNEKVDDLIISEIRRSGLLIADFTGHRGGVYFEAGFAMGLGIPVIWTCREDDIDKAHFDTRQYNHVTWTDSNDLKTKLINRITASIPGHYENRK
jgi:nucleoside 2-deoxyribosyltransferase